MPREIGSFKTTRDRVNILRGPKGSRIATETENGSAVSIPAAHAWGEALELRYSSARTSGFQGLYLHVDTSVAAASGAIRGMEVCAKRTAAVAVGNLEGANISAYARVDGAGDITTMYGCSGEIQVEDGYTGTIALLAGLRAKVATEDGSTVTAGYGVYIENEAVTGGKTLTAAIGIKQTAISPGFACLIDASGTLTTVSDDKVLLFKFQRSDGTVVFCRYDTSDNALGFATS